MFISYVNSLNFLKIPILLLCVYEISFTPV